MQFFDHAMQMKRFERRYHSSWVRKDGLSALSKLGAWMFAPPWWRRMLWGRTG